LLPSICWLYFLLTVIFIYLRFASSTAALALIVFVTYESGIGLPDIQNIRFDWSLKSFFNLISTITVLILLGCEFFTYLRKGSSLEGAQAASLQ
jgi:hypothetical protein